MANTKKTYSGQAIWTYEYARWQQRVEKLWKIRVRLSIRSTGRGTDVEVVLEAFTIVEDKPYTRLVKASFVYPSSNIGSFDTQVMGLLAAAEARIEEAIIVFRDQRNML